ncbi:MAG TPA: hypothetical protein PLU07_07175 [Ferruginibacter sp.]|nr:hypothetical protein [Ferruginibacter sp.]
MQKNLRYPKKRSVIRAARVEKTAETIGVSTSLVQKVLRGDRENPHVMKVFMEISEREDALLEQVKKLVPFK